MAPGGDVWGHFYLGLNMVYRYVVAFVVFVSLWAFTLASYACKDSLALAPDKALHFGGAGLIGAGVGELVQDKTDAFFLASVPLVAKEVWDSRHAGHCASVADLVWGMAGAGLGLHVRSVFVGPGFVVWREEF